MGHGFTVQEIHIKSLVFGFERSVIRKRQSAAGANYLIYPCESVPSRRGEAEGEDGSVSRKIKMDLINFSFDSNYYGDDP